MLYTAHLTFETDFYKHTYRILMTVKENRIKNDKSGIICSCHMGTTTASTTKTAAAAAVTTKV